MLLLVIMLVVDTRHFSFWICWLISEWEQSKSCSASNHRAQITAGTRTRRKKYVHRKGALTFHASPSFTTIDLQGSRWTLLLSICLVRHEDDEGPIFILQNRVFPGGCGHCGLRESVSRLPLTFRISKSGTFHQPGTLTKPAGYTEWMTPPFICTWVW